MDQKREITREAKSAMTSIKSDPLGSNEEKSQSPMALKDTPVERELPRLKDGPHDISHSTMFYL
jgi:hypothetical protein